MKTNLIQILGNKKGNIAQFIIFSVLVFLPPRLKEITPTWIILLKLSSLMIGVLCGLGLQKALDEMISQKEKAVHLSLIAIIVTSAIFVLN